MRKRMKYEWMLFLLSIFVWTICGLSAGAADTDETEESKNSTSIYFFHNTACGTCDGGEEFRELAAEQISSLKEICPYEILEYNVFKTGGKSQWDAAVEEYGLENESYIFPVMVLNGEMYTGMSEIREALFPAFLRAAGVSALYFYRKDCQECIDMEPFWESLPEVFECGGTEYPFVLGELESRTGNNGDMIRQLFEVYEVPDEDQMVPFVFLRDEYLAGHQKIEQNLLHLLEEGHGFLSEENKS